MKQLIAIMAILLGISGNATEIENWVEVKGGQWSPSKELISEIERQIVPQALLEAQKHSEAVIALEKYTFQYQGQYVGVVKTVNVHAYCEAIAGFDPSKEWLLVSDGGTCYLNALYDVSSKKFKLLFFNGEA